MKKYIALIYCWKGEKVNKKVTVVIPTYNRADTIARAVQSVLNQTYPDFEIIVVDDNSDDNTARIMQGIEDARIRYIRNNENLGAAAARNVGIRNATGGFIAFQDSDDEWHWNKLEKQIEKLENNKGYGAVYCAFMYKNNNNTYQVPNASEPVCNLEGHIYERLMTGNTVGTPALLVKKDVLDDVGGFNETLKSLEDWELALRISKKYLFAYVDECLVDAYYSENSVNQNIENRLLAQIYIYKTYFSSLKNKKACAENILCMVKDIKKLNNCDIYDKCINMLFSLGILNEMSLELVYREMERSSRFSWKYNILLGMYKHSNFARYIKEKIMNIESNNNAVALYGNGEIGKAIYKGLEKEEFKPGCIIDRNNIKENGIKIVQVETLPEKTSLIIMTIPGRKKIVQDIIGGHNIKVVQIEELL